VQVVRQVQVGESGDGPMSARQDVTDSSKYRRWRDTSCNRKAIVEAKRRVIWAV
jgi:hypothetical protein